MTKCVHHDVPYFQQKFQTKMKDFSSHFCIILPELLADMISPELCHYPPHGSIDIPCIRKVGLEQSPVNDENGYRWSISFSAITKDAFTAGFDGMTAYIGVFISDGTVRIIGRKDRQPVISVTPYAGVYAVTAEFETLKPIVI